MLQIILWYSYYIIYSFSFIYMLKLFQKDVNSSILILGFYSLIQINLFISFASFSFYVALMTKKYVSIKKRICFKKDLLMARDQLPNKIPVTYFPCSFMQNIVKVRSYHFKQKNVPKYDKILFACFYLLFWIILPLWKAIMRYLRKVWLP